MASTAYKWSGDLFCEGDIAETLLDHEPWSSFPDPLTGDAEADLDAIAAHFGIDRTNKTAVTALAFPVRLKGTPKPPQFCRVCMNWFS